MTNDLASFTRKKDYLICVDSDGCAMDTMDIKHIRCFGPCLIREWALEKWSEPILNRWKDINLYTMTRGINRFRGLAMMLREIHVNYTPIADLDALSRWVDTSPELSDAALERAVSASTAASLRKALSWSRAVNAAIDTLPPKAKQPFSGARKALSMAHTQADVAIVSSANRAAVLDEWALHCMLPHTDIVLAQDSGSKSHCIAELMKKGYASDHILMVGDAPGDLNAAQQNGVLYYPILVRQEEKSWAEFMSDGLPRLLSSAYAGEYQRAQTAAFLHHLGASIP